MVEGYWGLGIGDYAQTPIPNPQSPFLFKNTNLLYLVINK